MISLKPAQSDVFSCAARFRAVAAGRRFGKTYLSIVELVQAAWGSNRLAWYVAPTYKQAKRIAWRPLKEMTRLWWLTPPNETELRIDLITGGAICLKGADNYDSLRGDGLDFLVLDEYASIAPEAWTEVLRPALADKQGRALFIGTPQGFNHFHDLVERAQILPNWKAFQFTTIEGGNVSAEELQSAAQELDERTFRQEFEASFENLGVGRAYYAFDRAKNVGNLGFSPGLPLVWAIDFNMNPFCSVLAQVNAGWVFILDEMVLPDSNTLAACEEMLSRTEKLTKGSQVSIDVYGDATAEQRRTSASRTDWQIIKDFFGRYPDRFRASFNVPRANPAVKDRINLVNAQLRNHAGQHRLKVDGRCHHLIKDFEEVQWKSDPYGNTLADLNKTNPMRTHVSDAVGYFIAREFSMRPKMGERSRPALF